MKDTFARAIAILAIAVALVLGTIFVWAYAQGSFVGPQGPQGPAGPQGQQGPPGPTTEVVVTPTTEVIVQIEKDNRPATSQETTSNGWEISWFDGATEQMLSWEFAELDPASWPDFPNVDNDAVGFAASDGLEYAEDETGYCEQVETCDTVVPPLHYRIVTGDYDLGFDACKSADGTGCGYIMVNVGEVSTGLEDVNIDFGFTVWGRYWNGDAMPTTIWAALSHVGNNMLDLESTLNPDQLPNAGGNCSVPTGCERVRLAFYIMSGNELLGQGITVVSR